MKKRKKHNNFKHASPLKILKYSGFVPKNANVEVAKKHCYTIIKDISVTGEAPKDIIRYYQYGKSLKRKYKNWQIYIAKLGHKHYPMESITEQLITDIGLVYGFNMAFTKIVKIGGQIRLLSKYFLQNKREELYHGADLYAGFLNDDKFVDEVEKLKMTQDFFTIEFTKKVFENFFTDKEKEKIFNDFMRMLFFDALVGNNDRHMYNWGVIRSIFADKELVFSPIYDSARGLLWNRDEEQINNIISRNNIDNFVKKYADKSKPKIGIENMQDVNHFKLVLKYKDFYKKDILVKKIFNEDKINLVIREINTDYKNLMTKNRKNLIEEILKYRYDTLKNILEL